MILPMFGLILVLIVVGGLCSLVAIGDRLHARRASYIGFTLLFTGLGALLVSLLSYSFFALLGLPENVTGGAFFLGYGLGIVGGAASGFGVAARRQKQFS